LGGNVVEGVGADCTPHATVSDFQTTGIGQGAADQSHLYNKQTRDQIVIMMVIIIIIIII